MRVVIQRVLSASVEVSGAQVSTIGRGLLLLAGVEKGDTAEEIEAAADKIRELRIFGDAAGKMNLALSEAGGEILAVSQFTLAGSIARGRRPSFESAEEPGRARHLFELFVERLRSGGAAVKTGLFREAMIVRLENEGPVTFVYESRREKGEQQSAGNRLDHR